MEEDTAKNPKHAEEDEEEEISDVENLPCHLTVDIFNRVGDAKTLVRCIAVSKRIASLVPLTRHVSISFPCLAPLNQICPIKSSGCLRLLRNDDDIQSWQINFRRNKAEIFRDVSRDVAAAECCSYLSNLKPFVEMETLKVKICVSSSDENLPCVSSWKAELDARGLRSCVILEARAFGDRVECVKEFPLEIGWLEGRLRRIITRMRSTMTVMMSMACAFTTRRDAEVDVSYQGRQGRVHAGENEIIGMRRWRTSDNGTSAPRHLKIRMWYMPVLELPGSSNVMRGVGVTILMKGESPFGSQEDVTARCVDVMRHAFEDEESPVGEAAREIMKRMEMSLGSSSANKMNKGVLIGLPLPFVI